jgi:hypothetical protein
VQRKKYTKPVQFKKLADILEFTKCMEGGDRADQYFGCYRFTRRSHIWWEKLFFWLMEVELQL